MFSLNVPLPGEVRRLVSDLGPALGSLDRRREDPTLVVKRLGPLEEHQRLAAEARRALRGAPAFEARVSGLGAFDEPAAGPGPVVYLAVESPGLRALHGRLVERFGAVPGIEGDDYVPHVTLGRGGDSDALDRLSETPIEPVGWSVRELVFFDARHGEVAGRVGLPA